MERPLQLERGIDLAEVERLLEFAIVAVIAYAISDSVRASLLTSGYSLPQVTPIQWLAFFVCLLIYYKLIKVKLTVNR